jgi:SAM-dependent methyltransferase
MQRNRGFYTAGLCHGRGIEIGALHHPAPLEPGTRIRYVDRLPLEELRKQYPEISGSELVPVDIVDSGETLATLPDGQEDFVIAAQFIEHCQNPIRALVNMLRVIRPLGFVVLTVPDKRFTFDKDRAITTNEHLLDECLNGTEHTRRQHYREWVTISHSEPDPVKAEASIDNLMALDYSIHYHAWDSEAFLKFLLFAKERFRLPFEIHATLMNGIELITVLRKSG